jgi:hypothetical protein
VAFALIEVCPLAGRPLWLEEATLMIVVGLDVRRGSVAAVAIDEAGRPFGEGTVLVGSDELVGWASALGSDQRLWAVEDCRQLTRWLERQLLGLREELVRVPPKLMAPERASRQGQGEVGLDRRARRREGRAVRA